MDKKILLILAVVVFCSLGSADELTVCPSGCDYTKIQDAIDSADPGDTIIVGDGLYAENLKVNKSLFIRSENGPDKTVVQAEDPGDNVFLVTADDVTMFGFTITGATEAMGIYLDHVDHCNLFDNRVLNNYAGIYLWYSPGIMEGNIIANNEYGISIGNSIGSIIADNNVTSNNGAGVYLYYSDNNSIRSNIFVDDGLMVRGSYQNDIANNTVNGKPLVYLEGVSDMRIEDAGQVVLVRCENITVNGLILANTTVGIAFWETNDSLIENNDVLSNGGGIELHYSSGNTINGNTINSNNWAGIYLEDSSTNNLIGNQVNSNNECGIYLKESSGNAIYDNYFDNTENVYLENSVNRWNTTKTFADNIIGGDYLGGNYWSDYNGTDGDGIGDTPYVIDSDNIDYLPLVMPVTCKGDTDGDNIISDFELLDYIDLWAQGLVSDSDLLDAIDNWARGLC